MPAKECPVENKRKPRITALLCTLNEADNLPFVLPKIPQWVDEVLVIDGHSTDNTVPLVRQLVPRARVVKQPSKGKGEALKLGVQEATGDIIVTLDADGATDPADMQRFIQPLLEGRDFAKGSRFVNGTPRNRPWHRLMGNWIITYTFRAAFGGGYTDICSGYNAFWKAKFLKAVPPWPADVYENEPFINCRVRKGHLNVIEVPHSDGGRIAGEVKERSFWQGFKAIKTILRERLSKSRNGAS